MTPIHKLTEEQRLEFLQIYEEEMETNLRLYTSGKDVNAYERYKTISEYVRRLRTR
jgi:hypothetical protein